MYKLSENHEKSIQPKLENHFNKTLVKLSNYHCMDFQSIDGTFFEIKKRNCKSTQYFDSMIGYNKLEFCDLQPSNSIFVFEYTDKILYFVYVPKSKVKKLISGREDRGRSEMKDYGYFNICDMLEL